MTTPIQDLVIEIVAVGQLRPYAGNARRHPRRQRRVLVKLMRQNGCVTPLLIDENSEIIAGHARLEAAQHLGWSELPAIRLKGLTTAQKNALRIADNRVAELGAWNEELLQKELQALVDAKFDMAFTGFDPIDLDKILTPPIDPTLEDETPMPPLAVRPVPRAGDIWLLGKHRLLCGDSRDKQSYVQLLQGETAVLLATDAPFNVKINGHVSGNGRVKHDEFAMASGELSRDEFIALLRCIFLNCRNHLCNGALVYAFMDWRSIADLVVLGRELFDRHMNICVWAKRNAGLGSHYRSAHEMIAVFKHGTEPHINNIQFGRLGRNRTNLWQYDGGSGFSKTRAKDLEDHPTVKPLIMMSDIIRDASGPDDLVLDPFGGSGSTLIAAELTGRRAALIEIEPRFVDVTLRRFQERTGIEPVLLPQRIPLSVVAAERQKEEPVK